jgi:hypothetical protein
MATKKSTSKKAAKKSARKATKKAAKKPGIPVPPVLSCVQKCFVLYKRCLMSGGNPLQCHVRFIRCIMQCTNVNTTHLK